MKYNLTKPCNECPFRRESLAGWLGPWDPDDLLRVIGNSTFPCHRTVKPEDYHNEDAPHLESCAGMAIFLNNKVERSRNDSNRCHQELLRGSEHAPSVFRTGTEFLDHHKRA